MFISCSEEDLEHIDQSTADNKNISFAKDNNKNITHPQYIQLVISVALKVLHLLPVKRVLNKIQILDVYCFAIINNLRIKD